MDLPMAWQNYSIINSFDLVVYMEISMDLVVINL